MVKRSGVLRFAQIFVLLSVATIFCCAGSAAGTSRTGSLARSQLVESLPPERATLELHAHLFMKEGMTWAFRGDFEGPLRATSWRDKLSSQADPEALARSEIGVLVVALYAHPLFTMSLRDSVRRQIALAERFVAEHPEWMIARHARSARAALAEGKRVMILALEGADGIIESEEDLTEFVDNRGIRIVNLLHLTDDQFGGVAFLSGLKALASPWAWITQSLDPARDPSGTRINANGLTARGFAMAQALVRHGAWIDLAHASDRAQQALEPALAAGGIPRLHTHTALRKHLGAERGISEEQIARVLASGGIVGLMPSQDMLEDTRPDPARCKPGCEIPCRGGLPALATQYGELARALSPEQVALGSDYNGGIRHLPPYCALGTGLDTQGLWNLGQQAAVWDSLEKLGAPVPRRRGRMIERFLNAWEKANPSENGTR